MEKSWEEKRHEHLVEEVQKSMRNLAATVHHTEVDRIIGQNFHRILGVILHLYDGDVEGHLEELYGKCELDIKRSVLADYWSHIVLKGL